MDPFLPSNFNLQNKYMPTKDIKYVPDTNINNIFKTEIKTVNMACSMCFKPRETCTCMNFTSDINICAHCKQKLDVGRHICSVPSFKFT